MIKISAKEKTVKKSTHKWRRVNVLVSLVEQIEPLVETGDYSSIPSFVEDAIRAKLTEEAKRRVVENG